MNTNKKLKILILLIVFTILYLDIFYYNSDILLVEEQGKIETFFCKNHNCQHELLKITNESKSLICAFYDLTDEVLIKHLINENAKIISHNNENFEKINTKGLMHHKFCVINNTHVVMGSYNPTQINNHHENLIILESSTIAKNYEQEFLQLQQLNNKKIKEKEKTKTTQIIFNNYTLENYFCPQDNCKQKIINKINNANHTIYFMLFTFTDEDIAKALIQKKEEGLEIKGIIENFQNKKYWQVPILQENNITIRIHSAKELQHNKIFILDDEIITGSYNPTNSANTINDENILIISQKDIVDKYKIYFFEVFESLS